MAKKQQSLIIMLPGYAIQKDLEVVVRAAEARLNKLLDSGWKVAQLSPLGGGGTHYLGSVVILEKEE